MNKTFNELMERLKDLDEVELMELLEINSTDLVNEYEDRIQDKYDKIIRYLGEDYQDEETPDFDGE